MGFSLRSTRYTERRIMKATFSAYLLVCLAAYCAGCDTYDYCESGGVEYTEGDDWLNKNCDRCYCNLPNNYDHSNDEFLLRCYERNEPIPVPGPNEPAPIIPEYPGRFERVVLKSNFSFTCDRWVQSQWWLANTSVMKYFYPYWHLEFSFVDYIFFKVESTCCIGIALPPYPDSRCGYRKHEDECAFDVLLVGTDEPCPY